MKIVLGEKFKLGNVPEEILQDARAAGLSERGIAAARVGNKQAYREELRRLEKERMGSIWACTTGYSLLFSSSTESERQADYRRADRQLNFICRTLPQNIDTVPSEVVESLHRAVCDLP